MRDVRAAICVRHAYTSRQVFALLPQPRTPREQRDALAASSSTELSNGDRLRPRLSTGTPSPVCRQAHFQELDTRHLGCSPHPWADLRAARGQRYPLPNKAICRTRIASCRSQTKPERPPYRRSYAEELSSVMPGFLAPSMGLAPPRYALRGQRCALSCRSGRILKRASHTPARNKRPAMRRAFCFWLGD